MTDSEYDLRRAEAELALAQSATHFAAVRAHYVLACLYLDRAYGECIAKAPSPLDLAFGASGCAQGA